MHARRIFKDPGLYGQMLMVSGGLSLAAYLVVYFFVLHPFTFIIWLVLLPLVIVLVPFPPIFFSLALYGPFFMVLRRLVDWHRWWTSMLLTILVMFAVPLWVRADVANKARAISAGDVLTKPRLGKPGMLALVVARGSGVFEGGRYCGDFCLRVLLNGLAPQVAVFQTSKQTEPTNPKINGSMFSLARAADCPEVKLSKGRWIESDGKRRHPAEPRGHELLGQLVAKGLCLVRKDTTLAAADVIIASGHGKVGKTASQANFNLLADTLTTSTIILYRRENDQLSQEYRATKVTAYPPFAPLLFAFNLTSRGGGIGLRPGFTRFEYTLSRFGRTDLNRFLVDVLGLDLKLANFETYSKRFDLP